MLCADLAMTIPCIGGPLDTYEAESPHDEIVRAALAHGYRYQMVTEDGGRCFRFVGLRRPAAMHTPWRDPVGTRMPRFRRLPVHRL